MFAVMDEEMKNESKWDDLEYLKSILLTDADVSADVVDAVTSINGETKETLEEILHWATGYWSFSQFVLEECD